MKTRQSSESEPTLSPATKRARRDVVNGIADIILEKQCQGSSRTETNGYIKQIITTKQKIYPWLSRYQIYSRIGRIKRQKKDVVSRPPQRALLFSAASNAVRRQIGGRPKGSTKEAGLKKKNMRISAIECLCTRMKKERELGDSWKSVYDKIHDDVMKQFGLEDDVPIPFTLVKKRAQRGSDGKNKQSPVADIEPVLITFAVQRQEAGQPLKPSEGLELANSLIENTRLQSRLIDYQIAHGGNPTGELSKGFWRGFLRRHHGTLSQSKGFRLAVCRKDWTTYENLEVMYDLVYEQMVDAGVARALEPADQYWVNEKGEQVDRESEAAGYKVKHQITHPEWIIFGDEVGTNLDQTDDGHIGGQVYLVMDGTRAALSSSTATGRFTVIGFTAATGDPVMCLVVFAAEELTIMQRMGYDMRSDIPYDSNLTFEKNSGCGKAFPGGPTCIFRGKSVPAFITMSPKGSILSEILRAALERFDSLELYKREEGGPIPFALFDAHDSRLQLPFLTYINEKVNNRPRWKVCIGLPNGTALWQVGDSAQQNGCWKMAMYREKDWLLRYKQRMGIQSHLTKDDIIPLVNRCWAASFARKPKNIIAIRDRGWNPLDCRLLTRPDVQQTRMVINEETATSTGDKDVEEESPALPAVINIQDEDEMSSLASRSLSDLNFTNGLSKEFTVDLLQHLVRKKEVKQNLQKRYASGKEARGRLDAAKKLTGGTLFKSGHVLLDDEVAAIRKQKEDKKLDEIERPIRNAIEEYRKRRIAYEDVIGSNKPKAAYGKKEHKAIIHFLKRNSDNAVPQNSAPIKERYEQVRGRTPMTLTEYLTDRGYKDEVAKRVVDSFVDKEGNKMITEWL